MKVPSHLCHLFISRISVDLRCDEQSRQMRLRSIKKKCDNKRSFWHFGSLHALFKLGGLQVCTESPPHVIQKLLVCHSIPVAIAVRHQAALAAKDAGVEA